MMVFLFQVSTTLIFLTIPGQFSSSPKEFYTKNSFVLLLESKGTITVVISRCVIIISFDFYNTVGDILIILFLVWCLHPFGFFYDALLPFLQS